MRTGAGSDTAIFTALQRAAHQILDDAPRIFEDPIAVGLSPGSTEEKIRKAAAELQQPRVKLLRSNFVFRSRFAEDSLREAVAAGFEAALVVSQGWSTAERLAQGAARCRDLANTPGPIWALPFGQATRRRPAYETR